MADRAVRRALLDVLAKVGCADAQPIAVLLWPPSDFVVLFPKAPPITWWGGRHRQWAHVRVTGKDRARLVKALKRALREHVT